MYHRLVAPAKLQQQKSQVAMRLSIVSINPQSLLELLNRFVRFPYLRQTNAQVIVVMCIQGGPTLDCSSIGCYRVGPIAFSSERVAEIVVNVRTIGANR